MAMPRNAIPQSAFNAIKAAPSNTPIAPGGEGRIMLRPTATATSTADANGRCKLNDTLTM
jgi:hypothetical protein